MVNALLQVFFEFPTVLLMEILAAVTLSRMRVRHSLSWVIGSYLTLVAAALAFGLIRQDEFGFGFIPLIVLTAPWQLLHIKFPQSVLTGDLAQIALGLVLNCGLFYLIGRLSYPRYSNRLLGRRAT